MSGLSPKGDGFFDKSGFRIMLRQRLGPAVERPPAVACLPRPSLRDQTAPADSALRGFDDYIIFSYGMNSRTGDHALEFLLAFDGRIHHLNGGYWLKFEIKRLATDRQRPHGLSYSFTLHAPDGTRLVGFDNAHRVPATGSRFKRAMPTSDHWRRKENDPGRPYEFADADTLLQDERLGGF